MKYEKSFLRNVFLLKRKKKYSTTKKFNFNLIFSLIKKKYGNKKIIISTYYPVNHEVDTLKFVEEASKKKFKVSLPVIKSQGKMSFRLWAYKDPLYVNSLGILEPDNSARVVIPDLIMVPLVAFDKNLNRIGYGKGYYDRSLKEIRMIKKKTIFLGIGYSFQKCKIIPTNKHDFKLDYIFTERGIIN